MKKQFLTLSILFTTYFASAQVGVGTTTPHASAVLDVTSTTQGLLLPRMTQVQRDAIASPASGLLIWCTNCGSAGEFQGYNGTTWVNVTGGTASAGATVPGAPTSPVGTLGSTQVSVAFTAPASNGGRAITGYTVTSSPGGFTATGASSPLIVTGLTNGTAYTFTVVATNTEGNSSASTASASVTPNAIIAGNATCSGKTISATSCANVSGATINDDVSTADGIEYNWTGATTSGMANTSTTRALVEIGGQCWMRYNMDIIPASFNPAPTWVNSSDVGWSGYYTGGPFTNEGRLYQWSAVMNNSTTERGQGVCPSGWHIPSDCELMYLENTLGMSVANQTSTGTRTSGTVASDLSTLTSSGTNSSGFTALLAGSRNPSNGIFLNRSVCNPWWSSTESSSTAFYRQVCASYTGVERGTTTKADTFPIRCLKD